MAPMLVKDKAAPETFADSFDSSTLDFANRSCELTEYERIKKVPTFNISGEFIAYASPDSTYAVTKRLLDAAKKSILIGIYDFTAGYMKDILLNAMQRGVKVSLMLDLDGVKGESDIYDELERFGSKCVPAPSCASENISYFPSSHEKVIVIDDAWTLVQSGNYSKNSIPLNEDGGGGDPESFVKGNRDMGVAIRSKPLAAFFSKVLKSDMNLELEASGGEAILSDAIREMTAPSLVEAVPDALPVELFKSKSLNPTKPIKVTPILTPDNYMDVIPDFLESATTSIYIEQQYIRGKQNRIMRLLTSIRAALDNNPDLDVRIILGKIFSKNDVPKEKENLKFIKDNFGLKLGENIRYIDTKRFVHCHNKLIVVDKKAALVSSQNWSETGVGTNREAGVLMRYPEIARYYTKIFESDWSTAAQTLPKVGPDTVDFADLASGRFVEVSAADYQEV
jgi:phosphatidylserine/phosphatidylglycerophosphate/cardiolipin synthase-like enzyme